MVTVRQLGGRHGMMVPVMVDRKIVDALVELNPQPRGARWASLTYCILDAVWSIGARYDTVVVPLVRRVASRAGDENPLAPGGPDPLPVPTFRTAYPEVADLEAVTNKQRTSPTGGILKADAVLRHARVFADHGVYELATAATLAVDDPATWSRLDAALAAVPGDGQSRIRRGYLWMLTGDDHVVKPDRMVLRWLARHGADVSADEARVLLAELARIVAEILGRPVTPWMIDHAIWLDERNRPGEPGAGL
ncbi:hypothetical protein GCM10023107_12550 [Actinoplanes octamycinicus]